jgi:putative DNA primase/helicase
LSPKPNANATGGETTIPIINEREKYMDRMGIEGGSVALVGADAVLRPDLPSVTDAPPTSDAACQVALPATSDHVAEAFGQRLCPLNLKQLLALDIKPRGMVLDPIIPDKGLVMLYATRGTGKTHVALGIAHAVATGSTFLRWQAPRPRRVLLIDGEMPASALRERLQQLAAATDGGDNAEKLNIIVGDLVDLGIGNLASPPVQAELEPWLEGIDLLILDNLSSLTTALRENESDAWSPIQQWLLRLRRRGMSVLIVHHAGKGGEQRGTSRREDVLDTTLNLRRPSDYAATEGARFEVHIEKGRGIHGDHAKPFEAKLDICDGKAVWTVKDVEEMDRGRIAALLATGMTVRDVAEEIGISKSVVHRLKQKIEQEAAEAAAGQDAAGRQGIAVDG